MGFREPVSVSGGFKMPIAKTLFLFFGMLLLLRCPVDAGQSASMEARITLEVKRSTAVTKNDVSTKKPETRGSAATHRYNDSRTRSAIPPAEEESLRVDRRTMTDAMLKRIINLEQAELSRSVFNHRTIRVIVMKYGL
jgi:hypothetical protein